MYGQDAVGKEPDVKFFRPGFMNATRQRKPWLGTAVVQMNIAQASAWSWAKVDHSCLLRKDALSLQ